MGNANRAPPDYQRYPLRKPKSSVELRTRQKAAQHSGKVPIQQGENYQLQKVPSPTQSEPPVSFTARSRMSLVPSWSATSAKSSPHLPLMVESLPRMAAEVELAPTAAEIAITRKAIAQKSIPRRSRFVEHLEENADQLKQLGIVEEENKM